VVIVRESYQGLFPDVECEIDNAQGAEHHAPPVAVGYKHEDDNNEESASEGETSPP